MGVGRWIRNNWGLWSYDSELYRWFLDRGVMHPDDITGIIFKKVWCVYFSERFDFEAEVKYYQDYWSKHGKG